MKHYHIEALQHNDIEQTKKVIRQYIEWIHMDLSFQNIEQELAGFPHKYETPDGAFLVAKDGEQVVGCVGLKKWDDDICEMKRLYVIDEYKGLGIGSELVNHIIEEAKQKGYQKMRLDTFPKMKTAVEMYLRHGFYHIAQYVENPIADAIFLEKDLTT